MAKGEVSSAFRAAVTGFIALSLAMGIASAQIVPPAFRDKVVFSGLTMPTAIAFSSDGRVFVAEKSGLIKVFASLSATTPTVFADLRLNVYNYWDRGLLGLALHPNFPATPYVYVLYAFDAPIGGTPPAWGPGDGTSDPCPSPPGATDSGCVISGRLSRLTAAGNVSDGTEQVLINDWFQQFPSHSIGSVVFGGDGALYASGGEGASFNFADYGQTGSPLNPGGDPPVPIGTAQTPPTAEGGALRAQDLQTTSDPTGLSGSVIRIDPNTGAGMPDNPFASSPDPNARRIVAEGLRNPFRIAARPGTNEIWVGDVGWNTWEEINRIQNPTIFNNFGWPCYEGVGHQSVYESLGLNICSNLYAQGPAAVTSPHYTYNHSAKIVPGESCSTGSSSTTGLAFYTGTSYPASYQNSLFFADYTRQCVWVMLADATGTPNPSNLQTFVRAAPSPVQLTAGPNGDIFYVDINGGTIHRIQYFLPTAVISANPTSGSAPLTVNFDGSGSTDPDPTDTLTYAWDLNGDGNFSDATTPQTSYTFTTQGTHTVTLRVSDSHGGTDTETSVISVNDTPPVPTISAPLSTLTWKVGDPITFSGSAVDAQDGALPVSALSWIVFIHHCPSDCHLHTLQTWAGTSGGSFPAPDHEYPSYLEIKLTATDSQGLQASSSVMIYPQTVPVNLATVPAGLQLAWDDISGPAPLSATVILGSNNSTSAPSPQVLAGNSYEFSSWSDAGAASHNVTAGAGGVNLTATFVLQPPPSSLSASPSSVPGGTPSTGTVVLSGPAPASGAVVALSSSNGPVASVPPSVTVAPGATSATFPIATSSVSSATTLTLSAFYGAGNATSPLTVTVPPNSPPTIAISSPSSGSTFTSVANIPIQVNAADSDGSVTRVNYYSGSSLIGSSTIAPFGVTWNGVIAGIYSVTANATDNSGATSTSTPVLLQVNNPANPVAPPWTTQDIGAVGVAGNASTYNGSYTLYGGGLDIGGTADQFRFVWQPLSGSGQIVARLTGVDPTDTATKVGIMIRESAAANAANLAMVVTGGGRYQFQRRTATGGTTSYTSGSQTAPVWFKLVRTGDSFSGYKSSNGVSWTLLASYTVPMAGNVMMGLAVSGHSNTVTRVGDFDNVSLATGAPNSPPSVAISSPSNGTSFTNPTSVTITATASDSDGTVSRVDFYDGAGLLGSATAAPYSFVWNAPPQGTHSLTAVATDNLGATTTSSPAVGITVSYSMSGLPAPWLQTDVGSVGVAGSATYSAGVFSVTGSGNDMAGTSDQFRFAYQPMTGDTTIVARITGVQNTNASSKGGVLVRESLAPNAANTAMIITAGGRLQFQRRPGTGATTTYSSWNQATPYWVKLVRTGDTFSAYRSSNGTVWTLAGSYVVPMASTVYVGLGMTSHDNTVTGLGTFDNVTVTSP